VSTQIKATPWLLAYCSERGHSILYNVRFENRKYSNNYSPVTRKKWILFIQFCIQIFSTALKWVTSNFIISSISQLQTLQTSIRCLILEKSYHLICGNIHLTMLKYEKIRYPWHLETWRCASMRRYDTRDILRLDDVQVWEDTIPVTSWNVFFVFTLLALIIIHIFKILSIYVFFCFVCRLKQVYHRLCINYALIMH
jgi:hypothetical protein